jgi:hypothetical protein
MAPLAEKSESCDWDNQPRHAWNFLNNDAISLNSISQLAMEFWV